MPAFGHSTNHAGLQITDLICSGLLCPIAIYSYCLGSISNVHVTPQYKILKDRYAHRLQKMQYRYQQKSGTAITPHWMGGVTVSDSLSQRNSSFFFK
jgi:hypothetical protein